MSTATSRADLHRLVDELPEHEIHVARRFLEYLGAAADDPVLQAFQEAPEDEELLSEEGFAALAEGEKAAIAGDVLSWREVRAHFAKGD